MSGEGIPSTSQRSTAHNDDGFVNIRVITSDLMDVVHFRVRKTLGLGRLKRSYCSKMGTTEEEWRFVYDGHRITDDDTPKDLNMMDDDIIELYKITTGGM